MAKAGAKKTKATKTTKTTKTTKRASNQRDLVRHGSRSAYAKRTDTGQFKELDDVGRSQTPDRRVKAKTVVKAGFGDQGDQRPRRTAKKR
jgi:hypothetical protein